MTSLFAHDLTISLIVKNEADTLKACLEALTPLRNALKCQLILTDTGSTDGTQDIAKEFADLYLEFDWCNDFSKARNHAIPHATGRWFFYLDADEVCDDTILEIAAFLKAPESHTIGAATVIVRNYSTPPSPPFSDFLAPRLINFGKGPRFFRGSVHESFAIHRGSGSLPVVLHHSGYLKENIEKKKGRNAPLLLKEVEERPQDLRSYVHLIQDCSDLSEKNKWIQQALAVTDQHPETKQQFFYPALLIEWARTAQLSGDPSSLPLVQQRLLCDPDSSFFKTLPHLEFLGLEIDILLKDPSETLLPLLTAYQSLFSYLQKSPDRTYHGVLAYRYIEPFHHGRVTIFALDALQKQGFAEEVKTFLQEYKGYQWQEHNKTYPLLPKTTYLCLELDLFPKVEEIRLFLKEQGATQDFIQISRLLATHLKQKGQAPL